MQKKQPRLIAAHASFGTSVELQSAHLRLLGSSRISFVTRVSLRFASELSALRVEQGIPTSATVCVELICAVGRLGRRV